MNLRQTVVNLHASKDLSQRIRRASWPASDYYTVSIVDGRATYVANGAADLNESDRLANDWELTPDA